MSGKQTTPPRMDPRSDPDDGGLSAAQRVDVVNIDRSSEGPSAASLRRELAKLQQALDEQRLERRDALDRAERATEHALQLEGRLARLEKDLEDARGSAERADGLLVALRGDLAAANEVHRATIEELRKAGDETTRLRIEEAEAFETERQSLREQSARLEREAADARSTAEQAEWQVLAVQRDLATATEGHQAEIEDLRGRHEQELGAARAEIANLRADLERMRGAVSDAEARADGATRARLAFEESVGVLQDEINAAFARVSATARERDVIIAKLGDKDEGEKKTLLVDILRTHDDEIVLAAAIGALVTLLPLELDAEIVDRLLAHPSARVQRAVKELVDPGSGPGATIDVD